MSVATKTRPVPIAGRRILLTRDADDARRWAHRLTSAGAVPIVFPCIMCEPVGDPTLPDRLRSAMAQCHWVVFSSVRGVEATAALLERSRRAEGRERLAESREPRADSGQPRADSGQPRAGRCIATVGASTAMAASLRFGRVDLVAKRATSAALGADLGARLAGTGERVLVLGAEGGRTDVESALAEAGVACTRLDVYRTVPVSVARTRRDLGADGVQDILLASPSAVAGLCNSAVIPPDVRIITIGPTTTSAAQAAGLHVWAEAAQPSLEGMLEALQ